MKSDKYLTSKLRLKTITPIFIGTNQANELSPYSDFIQETDKVILIDQSKLEKAFESKPNLIDEFVKNIRYSMDKSKTRSDFDLKEFLDNNFGDINQFKKYELPSGTDLGKTKIRRFISTNGFPFIPGSTIKGALRTAIFYDWLINSEIGKQKFNNFINSIQDLLISKKRRIELEEKKKIIKLLDNKEFSELKSLPNQKEIEKKLNELLNEQMLFGTQRNNPTGFDARHLKVSDTEKFTISNISISKLVRIKLKHESEVSPLPSEIVDENTETSFNFTIEKSFKQNSLFFFNSCSISDLFRILNQFSTASIDYEINTYKSFHIKQKSKISDEITNYSNVINFYEELKKFIIKSNNRYAIIRLGSGKTYFDNSIGIAIYNKDAETFQQFRELLELGKNPQTKKLVQGNFPTTRTLVESTSLPIGWILIQEFNNNIIDLTNIYTTNAVKKKFESESEKSKTSEIVNPQFQQNRQSVIKKNYLIAEIIEDKSKPPKVKILEGEHKDEETILPGVRLETFGLTKDSKVYIELFFQNKKVQKAEYKGRAD